MRTIFIEHNIILSFFKRTSKNHLQAVNYIAHFLKEKEYYVISSNGIFLLIENLIEEILDAKEQKMISSEFEVEKNVVNKINSLITRLNIKILYTSNNHIFSQTLSLQEEYQIKFATAFYTAQMMENKIKTIATFEENYSRLFSEGVLTRYLP